VQDAAVASRRQRQRPGPCGVPTLRCRVASKGKPGRSRWNGHPAGTVSRNGGDDQTGTLGVRAPMPVLDH
jgi:hypothetical protein